MNQNDSLSHSRKRPILARIFISPEERRLRAGWRLLIQTLLWLVLMFGLIISFGFISGRFFPNELSLSVIASLFSVTISVFLARKFLDRRSIKSLGLKTDLRALWDLLVGIGIAAAMMAFIYALEWAFGWLSFEGFAWQNQSMDAVLIGTLEMLLIFVLVGWEEELLSRGYHLQNLAAGINLTWGVILSSLIFALMHLGNPNVSVMAVLGLIAAGFFLAFGYLRTRQLWLPIGLHIGWNFFEGTVFGFQVSGLDIYRLIEQTVQGPQIFTGGKFGPEAGLILIPGLALGVTLIYVYSGSRNNEGGLGDKG
jgi:membrane protease YdiL (CAAX protease family)